MTGDLVRILADWLAHASHGVNALLASVPRDVGDAQPSNVDVQDETRDDRIARGRVPESGLPALLVTCHQIEVLGSSVAADDGFAEAELVLRYVTSKASAKTAKQDAGYVLRAAVWSIRRLRRLGHTDANRARNQVVVGDIGPIQVKPFFDDTRDVIVAGLLSVRFRAYDAYSL